MKRNDRESWADAVEVDKAIRVNGKRRGMDQTEYMHRSLIALEDAPLANENQYGFGFLGECEGMCGV